MGDAAAVVAIRAAVGPGVVLRADANRLWSLNKARQFASAAQSANLEVHPCPHSKLSSSIIWSQVSCWDRILSSSERQYFFSN